MAEVEVATDGTDCGMVVNPDTLAAQMEGGSIFGLTAALHGAITLKDGRVEQSDFDTYLPMRIDEAPVVDASREEQRGPRRHQRDPDRRASPRR